MCTESVSDGLSSMLSRASFSTALQSSASRFRNVEIGEELEEGGLELKLWRDESSVTNLSQGLSRSLSSLWYDVRRGSFFRYRSISRQFCKHRKW
jgi:hypothetical protein